MSVNYYYTCFHHLHRHLLHPRQFLDLPYNTIHWSISPAQKTLGQEDTVPLHQHHPHTTDNCVWLPEIYSLFVV
jgi:hypothetical protein